MTCCDELPPGECRYCHILRSHPAEGMVPYCRVHDRREWEVWRGVSTSTRCLHCTHGNDESRFFCPHCDREGRGHHNLPDTCVHCALVCIEVPLPHRRIEMEKL